MKRLLFTIFLILYLCSPAWAANYYVETTDSSVDGDTFCGGGQCTSADTIYIRGGARGDLEFKDFDGDGSYITITNEDVASRVIITNNGVGDSWAPLGLKNCSYIDLRGDGRAGETYGIKVIHDGDPAAADAVWAYQEGDHIKISYLEIAFDGNTTDVGDGIGVKDPTLTNSSIFDTFEIHHNFIHGSRYAGMYLGQNTPPSTNLPWIANMVVHDNLLEDCGYYGINVKGVHSTSGATQLYNNIIRGSAGGQSTGLTYPGIDRGRYALGLGYHYNNAASLVYNNWIEKTVGPGMRIDGAKNVEIYNNVILGCGTGDDSLYGHGIVLGSSFLDSAEVYQNTILESTRYGIYGIGTLEAGTVEVRDNIIAESVIGEWACIDVGDMTEASGAGANTYDTDVDNLNFTTWSDDSDYTNDDFSLLITSPALEAGAASGYPATDYIGTVRPQGSLADDGAYEYVTVGLKVNTVSDYSKINTVPVGDIVEINDVPF